MQTGFTRLTLEIPDDFHEELRRICFEERTTMKDIIIELLAKRLGKPVPKFVDRRRLTLEERRKLEKRGR
jgi:hypothetical protein